MGSQHTEAGTSDEANLPTNWGRWGEDDQRGTLNLITDEARARAAAEVRTGRAVSLALPIQPTPVISGPFAPATQAASPVQQLLQYTGCPPLATAEVLIVTNHHPRSTHLDALAHMPRAGRVYPGRPLDECVTVAGVRHGSTAAFSAGVATRGVLLDLAADGPLPSGYAVTSEDFDAAEERENVRLEAGDALVVRCGWAMTPDADRPMPGMTLDAVQWMHRRGVSLYAGDIGDAHPALDPACPAPLHGVALPLLGLPLIDAVETGELSAACAELGRYAFLLTVAPPRIDGLTGVPVNPLALF
ncbi:cyclase family protein [Amycolatopsis australiensis]|uniref:Kynurenine formamidase n=1 Tax=Amycolatopsis australiensis TaxID=546364 RepID=A0A1K1SB56_9PSEU|nr:cyclase family protein [Amycolatopsis australiensis]SFW81332.1 Kynurenine formamidase [Amycolatopsis australiensis]